MQDPINCGFCGKPVEEPYPGQIYCSKRCKALQKDNVRKLRKAGVLPPSNRDFPPCPRKRGTIYFNELSDKWIADLRKRASRNVKSPIDTRRLRRSFETKEEAQAFLDVLTDEEKIFNAVVEVAQVAEKHGLNRQTLLAALEAYTIKGQ